MLGSSEGDVLTWEAHACEEGTVRALLDASSHHPGPTCLVPCGSPSPPHGVGSAGAGVGGSDSDETCRRPQLARG